MRLGSSRVVVVVAKSLFWIRLLQCDPVAINSFSNATLEDGLGL